MNYEPVADTSIYGIPFQLRQSVDNSTKSPVEPWHRFLRKSSSHVVFLGEDRQRTFSLYKMITKDRLTIKSYFPVIKYLFSCNNVLVRCDQFN